MALKSKQLEDLLKILKIKPMHRSKWMILRLTQETHFIPLFQQQIEQGNSNIHYECCKHMFYESHKNAHAVFNIDEIGDKFYIIIKGHVGVWVRPNIPLVPNKSQILEDSSDDFLIEDNIEQAPSIHLIVEQQNPPTSPEKRRRLQQTENSNSPERGGFQSQVSINHLESETLFNSGKLIKVRELQSGDFFGEMALLSNKPRLASIVCEEDCHFAVLSKEDFDRILKQATEKNYLKEIENLGRLPIFQGWNSLQLRRIYLNSYRQTYLRKQCVFQEGKSQVDSVFVVMSGEFRISKNLQVDAQTTRDKLDVLESVTDNGLMINNKKTSFQKSKEVQLYNLIPFDLMGEEDLIAKRATRSITCTCESVNGELLMFKKNDFQNIVLADTETRKYVRNLMRRRQEFLYERFANFRHQFAKFSTYFLDDTQFIMRQANERNKNKNKFEEVEQGKIDNNNAESNADYEKNVHKPLFPPYQIQRSAANSKQEFVQAQKHTTNIEDPQTRISSKIEEPNQFKMRKLGKQLQYWNKVQNQKSLDQPATEEEQQKKFALRLQSDPLALNFYRHLWRGYQQKFQSQNLQELKSHIDNSQLLQEMPRFDHKIITRLRDSYVPKRKAKSQPFLQQQSSTLIKTQTLIKNVQQSEQKAMSSFKYKNYSTHTRSIEEQQDNSTKHADQAQAQASMGFLVKSFTGSAETLNKAFQDSSQSGYLLKAVLSPTPSVFNPRSIATSHQSRRHSSIEESQERSCDDQTLKSPTSFGENLLRRHYSNSQLLDKPLLSSKKKLLLFQREMREPEAECDSRGATPTNKPQTAYSLQGRRPPLPQSAFAFLHNSKSKSQQRISRESQKYSQSLTPPQENNVLQAHSANNRGVETILPLHTTINNSSRLLKNNNTPTNSGGTLSSSTIRMGVTQAHQTSIQLDLQSFSKNYKHFLDFQLRQPKSKFEKDVQNNSLINSQNNSKKSLNSQH